MPLGETHVVIGLLRLRLMIHGARSLKDRRRAVKSLKERIAARFNASVAEVGDLESYRSATIACTVVGNESPFVEGVLAKIVDLARTHPVADLVDYATELITP